MKALRKMKPKKTRDQDVGFSADLMKIRAGQVRDADCPRRFGG